METGQEKKDKPKRIYKGRQVNVRLSDDDYEAIETKAKAAGFTVPQTIKKIALNKKIAPRKPPKINDEIALSIASELRRIGQNVNQIAKATNIEIEKSDQNETLKAIREELAKIWRMLN